MPEEITRQSLERAIAAMETQRSLLGDDVVNATIAILREKLASLPSTRVGTPAVEATTATPKSTGSLAREESAGRLVRKPLIVLIASVAGNPGWLAGQGGQAADGWAALWRQLDATVQVRDGVVYRHTGNALAALWGYPVARENDYEQAVRAALDLRMKLNALNDLRSPGQPGLTLQVGVHTGSVVMQPGVEPEQLTASGEAFVGADALRQAAPAGEVLISYQILRVVRGVFGVVEQAPVSCKGLAAPLPAYLVQRAYPRAFHLGRKDIEGLETDMVGREKELSQLQNIYRGMAADSRRRMVVITGEAGVGKSRLIYEFEKWIDLLPESVRYFKGRAAQDMQSRSYSLVRDLFSYRFQILDSDHPDQAREKIERGFTQVMGESEETLARAHFVAHLMGISMDASPYLKSVLPDSRQLRDRAAAYINDYFKAASSYIPAVVFLEDMHFADDSSLDVIEDLSFMDASQRLLLVVSARPGLFERRPGWMERNPASEIFYLSLKPLSEGDARRLVKQILRKVDTLPAGFSSLIVENTNGNPYFVEELIKMLIEEGVIIKGDTHWRVAPERLDQVRIPATLEGVLRARLERLTDEELGTIQRAAVVGPVFWDQALAYRGGSAPVDEQIAPGLEGLAAREMVIQQPASSFAHSREYTFKHAILRDVAYQSLMQDERLAHHARVAAWMEAEIGRSGREGEYASLIAGHYDQAGDARSALEWYTLTGHQAAARFGNTEAVRCFSRALVLAPEADAASRFDLLYAREQALDLMGERLLQSGDLDDLEELAVSLADKERQARVALRRANYFLVVGDYQASTVQSQKAVGLALQVVGPRESAELAATAFQTWGHALWRQSRNNEAREKVDCGLKIAREHQMTAVNAGCMRLLGELLTDQGEYQAAREYHEQALAMYRQLDNRQGEADTLSSLGNLAISRGDHVQARAYHEQAYKSRRQTGDRRGEGRALGSLGYIASDQGDYGASRVYFEQAIEVFRVIGDRQGEATALINLGNDALLLGDLSSALAYQDRALILCQQTGDRQGECIVMVNLSLLYHHLGDDEKALSFACQAQEMIEELGQRYLLGFAMNQQGLALLGLGRLEESCLKYQRAIDARLELGQANMAAESRAGLAKVYLMMGEARAALAQTNAVLDYLKTGSVDGMIEPLYVYLTLYQALRVAGDTRASQVIKEGYQRMLSRAEKIPDLRLRRSYLEQIPAHREVGEIIRMLMDE